MDQLEYTSCCINSIAAPAFEANGVFGSAKKEVDHFRRLRHFVRCVAQQEHHSLALRELLDVPHSAGYVVERKDPAYGSGVRGEVRIEYLRKNQGLLRAAVAEQKRTWIGMCTALVVDKGVLVREEGCAATQQFGNQRGLAGVRGSRKEQCPALDKHRAGVDCAQCLDAVNQEIIQRLDGGQRGVLGCRGGSDQPVVN